MKYCINIIITYKIPIQNRQKNMEKKSPEKTGEVCPECGKMLVVKNEKIKCSECSYEK